MNKIYKKNETEGEVFWQSVKSKFTEKIKKKLKN
jgi:hypothetical protein